MTMNETDYSFNVKKLKESEIYDFDTVDEHETGINVDRMRLPDRYDIAKYYKRDYSKPSSYDDFGNPRYEKGTWEKKENPPHITKKDFEWQVTYKFPSSRHPNKAPKGKYGGNNVTYRRLYLILCEHFNGGNFFIDEYFETIYPYTMRPEVDARLQPLKEQIISFAEDIIGDARITQKGTLDKRTKKGRLAEQELKVLEELAQETEDRYGEILAKEIKDDIIASVTNGALPCQMFADSWKTIKARTRVGLSAFPRFSATEELIRSIKIYVKIGGNKQWQTRQGILV